MFEMNMKMMENQQLSKADIITCLEIIRTKISGIIFILI